VTAGVLTYCDVTFMAVVKAVMNRRVLQSAGSFFSHWRTGSFSRRTLL